MDYELTWITERLAVGHAPMSHAQLELIRDAGVNAIVNLCAEFSDLHEIEEKAGFEVCYLPIWDEDVPEMANMEEALAWMDEAIYLGKKVLVHCRHGIGRTGTFVTAYLIRKGLGLKAASKKLKRTLANPSTYGQWKLVKKYNKQSGMLKIRKPSLEIKNQVDLSHFFSDYEALVEKIDQEIERHEIKDEDPCGSGSHCCCARPFKLPFIEVIYLHTKMGWYLSSARRETVIHRARAAARQADAGCPFNQGKGCEIFKFRPVRCRAFGAKDFKQDSAQISPLLQELSRSVFLAFSGEFLETGQFQFSVAETVSGKFVQAYFNHMAAQMK
ncbi:MAG: dual specificity protein phosphatase family protein [Desulfobacter sp.]|nr:MAG: dual specificity protein phosphatase family protein [Desulfobacter sp.]